MREIALYIHFPFCLKKCRYCDFVSYPGQGDDCYSDYFHSVYQELMERGKTDSIEGASIKSIYFGGGTPSLASPKVLGQFLSLLSGYFVFSPSIEVTLEANPGTLHPQKLRFLSEIGVNRLSLGIQSFNDRHLRFLGRTYAATDVFRVLEEVVNACLFPNYSVDMIYSLPLQTLSSWKKEIEFFFQYDPPHISIYNLTVSPQVPLYSFWKRHRAVFPSQDEEATLYQWTRKVLRKRGYDQYEISNFARPGYECLHNLTYWRNQESLGLGVSACSYLEGKRQKNTWSYKRYRQMIESGRLPTVMQEILPPHQKMVEDIILALRTREGISRDRLLRHYPLEMVRPKQTILQRLTTAGLLRETSDGWTLSPRGIRLANQVFVELMD